MELSGSINHGSASGLLLGDLGSSYSVCRGDTRSSVACTCVCAPEQGPVASEAGPLPLLKSVTFPHRPDCWCDLLSTDSV